MAGRRLAILGGGIGGLSTALALTDPSRWAAGSSWRNEFDSITVYQMGWRLGGKCASGHGPAGRIEEHGIHLFGGGYYNTLRLMPQLYAELQAGTGGWPLSFDDAFERQWLSLSFGGPSGRRMNQGLNWPANGLPLNGPASLADLAHGAAAAVGGTAGTHIADSLVHSLAAMISTLRGLLAPLLFNQSHLGALDTGFSLLKAAIPGGFDTPSGALQGALDDLVTRLAQPTPQLPGIAHALEWLATCCHQILTPLAGLVQSSHLAEGIALVDLVIALARGIVVDLLLKGAGLDKLDQLDWAAWLQSHGAGAAALRHPVALAPLNILYQPRSGSAPQRMGAGGYVQWQLRTLGYLQAPFWFFRQGTGESVVLPMYEALRRRGVRFEFFCKVEELVPSADGQTIASVRCTRQAALAPGRTQYQPLDTRGPGQLPWWPSAPLTGQLADPGAIAGLDLESYFNGVAHVPGSNAWHLRHGTDYTDLVLAMPPGALPYIGRALLAQHPQTWGALQQGLTTVATQSLQLWFRCTSPQLGMRLNPPPRDGNDTALGCGFEKPFDGVVDFTPLIAQEGWPAADAPAALWYFSDVLDEDEAMPAPGAADPDYPARMKTTVRTNCLRFLDQRIDGLLPLALRPHLPDRFDHDTLHTHTGQPAGTARFDQQYWRANVEPTERYTASPPNTTRLRLKADQSGYRNLTLAGDWVYTGLNVGCVEATVMSGLMAANVLCHRPLSEGVLGFFANHR